MKKNSLILVATLLILGLAAYLVMQQPGETSSTGDDGEKLASYDSAAVDKIEIHSPAGAITLANEAGTWMVIAPTRHRADGSAVASAIGRGRNVRLTGLVSTNPGKQGVFQVDSLGTRVLVYEHGTLKAGFVIGKPGPSWTETYVRRDGSTDVYLGEGPLSYLYAKSLKDWRDRTILREAEGTVKTIRYQYGDTVFALQFRDSLWTVDDQRANDATVRGVVSSLSNLQADDFIDTLYTPSRGPAAVVTVGTRQVRFYFDRAAGRYAVQASQDPQWFEIQSWKGDQVLKRRKEFLAP
jgi:hypothetical protein